MLYAQLCSIHLEGKNKSLAPKILHVDESVCIYHWNIVQLTIFSIVKNAGVYCNFVNILIKFHYAPRTMHLRICSSVLSNQVTVAKDYIEQP